MQKYQVDFTKLYLMAKIFLPLALDWLYNDLKQYFIFLGVEGKDRILT